NFEAFQEFVRQPVLEAGDVVLFSEATTHGTLAWSGEHQRRTVIYRFAPSNHAYGRSYCPSWPEAMLEGMTRGQKAVLEPPYNNRLDRPVPSVENFETDETVVPVQREEFKIEHDTKVFGTKYF
ncbi:hypothetical protein CYMTET_31334, partial [Cymbomonas tetramitiformis]